MDQDARWMCDAEDRPHVSWMGDAPWAKANTRDGHWHPILTKDGVIHNYTGLGEVNRETFTRQLFYGNCAANSREMMGFASFYANLDKAKVQCAANVLDAGGEEGTSIWFVGWHPRTVYMVTPDGDPPEAAGEAALVVGDWRYIVRVANVDDVSREAVELWMARVALRVPSINKVRPVFYLGTKAFESYGSDVWRNIFVREMPAIRSDEPRVN